MERDWNIVRWHFGNLYKLKGCGTNFSDKLPINAGFLSFCHCSYTLKKESLNEWGYSLVTVLHSKALVQRLNFHSVNKEITCSVTEEYVASLIGLLKQILLAYWARTLLCSTVTKEYPHSFKDSFWECRMKCHIEKHYRSFHLIPILIYSNIFIKCPRSLIDIIWIWLVFASY